MSRPRQRPLLLATLVVLALVAASVPPVRATPVRAAPRVVDGRDGYLLFGLELDQACQYGARLRRGMRHLDRLAETIAESGRRVVFTVAPNHTSVRPGLIRRRHPHGACATRGIAAQQEVVDHFGGDHYLPLREQIAADRRQTYWRTDPHWTANGGADYSQALAARLRPSLAARQSVKEGVETQLGLFNEWLGRSDEETVRVARPTDPDAVTSDPTSTPWTGTPRQGRPPIAIDHSWTTAASAHPFPGHTVLIGDSFTLYALGTLRPLFRHGRFLWFSNVDPAIVVQAVQESDTVVIEVAQFLVQHAPIGRAAFRQTVADALGVS